jgi:hypothetical protein
MNDVEIKIVIWSKSRKLSWESNFLLYEWGCYRGAFFIKSPCIKLELTPSIVGGWLLRRGLKWRPCTKPWTSTPLGEHYPNSLFVVINYSNCGSKVILRMPSIGLRSFNATDGKVCVLRLTLCIAGHQFHRDHDHSELWTHERTRWSTYICRQESSDLSQDLASVVATNGYWTK